MQRRDPRSRGAVVAPNGPVVCVAEVRGWAGQTSVLVRPRDAAHLHRWSSSIRHDAHEGNAGRSS